MRLLFALLLFAGSSAFAAESEKVLLTRSIVVEVCDDSNKCIEHPSTHSGAAEIELKPFKKGNESGLHGEDKLQVMADGNPFKSEIFVNKTKSGYSINAVLRSGEGTKRKGVTQKSDITSFADFKPLLLTDKVIVINGKKYQAKLKITPMPRTQEAK